MLYWALKVANPAAPDGKLMRCFNWFIKEQQYLKINSLFKLKQFSEESQQGSDFIQFLLNWACWKSGIIQECWFTAIWTVTEKTESYMASFLIWGIKPWATSTPINRILSCSRFSSCFFSQNLKLIALCEPGTWLQKLASCRREWELQSSV